MDEAFAEVERLIEDCVGSGRYREKRAPRLEQEIRAAIQRWLWEDFAALAGAPTRASGPSPRSCWRPAGLPIPYIRETCSRVQNRDSRDERAARGQRSLAASLEGQIRAERPPRRGFLLDLGPPAQAALHAGGPRGPATPDARPRLPRRVSLTRAASIPPCTAGSSGPCASSPAWAPPRQTNERYHFLLEKGQTGLSVAFDNPTLYGLRLRPPAGRRRGRQVRRGGGHPARHGEPVRRHPARPGLDLDDHQRPGGLDLRHVPGQRREARHRLRASCAARSRTTSSRSTSPRRNGSSRPSRTCASSPT